MGRFAGYLCLSAWDVSEVFEMWVSHDENTRREPKAECPSCRVNVDRDANAARNMTGERRDVLSMCFELKRWYRNPMQAP